MITIKRLYCGWWNDWNHLVDEIDGIAERKVELVYLGATINKYSISMCIGLLGLKVFVGLDTWTG